MFRDAMDAADYAIGNVERAIDRAIGAPLRRCLERYACATVVAVPIAWMGAGLRWNATAALGLVAGLVLFAILDTIRASVRNRKGGRRS